MTCQEIDERLDEWLDGTLPPAEAAFVRAHLDGCAACREGERRLRQVLAHAAALPRSVAPARDLWPGIERRLGRGRFWSGLFDWTPSMALAAAATLILALAAVVWTARAKAPVQTAQIPSASPSVEAMLAGTGTGFDPVLAQAERDYENAANALLQALQQRRAALSPQDFALLQTNLQVIDRALAEVRGALVQDPANPELNRMLVSTHRKKVDVLRRVVRLSTVL